MEFYQSCQNRAIQTIAVVNLHLPGLKVGGVDTGTYSSLCSNLDSLAATRDSKVSDEDTARNAENLAFQTLRTLTLSLPKAADAELDDDIPEEAKLQSHLDEVYAITPRTTELALQRARKLVAALVKINAWLTGRVPPRAQVSAGGKDLSHLNTAISVMPSLEQALEDKAAGARDGRTDLRNGATGLDRISKRYYKKLLAEARTNPDVAEAIKQIETDSANLPETLSIQSVLQAGPGFLSLHLSYVPGSGSDALERRLEWMVEDVDADFSHTTAANLSGNDIGPFTVGQTILVRTRTVNNNGTRTSAVRKLKIVPV